MRILLTGGTGFIGSMLAERLRDRNVVYCLVRNDEFRDNRVEGVEYVQGDLLNPESLRALFHLAKPEVVVHLAAYTPVRYSFDNPLLYAHVNYLGTVNLVEAALHEGQVEQFVYASTAEIYGPYEHPHTVTEESVPAPTSPYSVAKLAGEHYVRYASYRQKHLWCTVMRPTNSYGRAFNLPDDARGYFVEKMVIGLLRGKVEFDGSPHSTRRFMRVEDHVHAYLRAIGNRRAYGEVFNVAPDEPAVTLGQAVSLAREIVGAKEDAVAWGANPRPLEPNHLDIDGSKIRRRLDWRARYTFREGLSKTIDYWKEKLAAAGGA
jgi:nucleoside-diphosphate-sugar epimerase